MFANGYYLNIKDIMNDRIAEIKKRIEPLRQRIINHPIYGSINDIDSLRIFMQHHVYAVWDFMSLLKSLQINLTCTSLPWFPKGLPETRYLINEIVIGEESDVDFYGNRKSHFEMYIDAMNQCGANKDEIMKFVSTLQQTGSFLDAYLQAGTPQEIKSFVNFTFSIATSTKSHLQAAVFTFGREDLIPEMFGSILTDISNKSLVNTTLFKYYIERHIEVDGGHHAHLATEMLNSLCGEDETLWQEAGDVIEKALLQRINLWNGAYAQIKSSLLV